MDANSSILTALYHSTIQVNLAVYEPTYSSNVRPLQHFDEKFTIAAALTFLLAWIFTLKTRCTHFHLWAFSIKTCCYTILDLAQLDSALDLCKLPFTRVHHLSGRSLRLMRLAFHNTRRFCR